MSSPSLPHVPAIAADRPMTDRERIAWAEKKIADTLLLMERALYIDERAQKRASRKFPRGAHIVEAAITATGAIAAAALSGIRRPVETGGERADQRP